MKLREGSYLGTTVTPTVDTAPGIWSLDDVVKARTTDTWPISEADRRVFLDGTDGFLYKFDNIDQLFTTSTGITPVTTAGDDIGFALESHAWNGKSLDYVIAHETEILGDADFASSASWTFDGTGWSISGGDAFYNGNLNSNRLRQLTPAKVNGYWYRTSADILPLTVPNTSARIGINIGGSGQNVLVNSSKTPVAGVTEFFSGFGRQTSVSTSSFTLSTSLNHAVNWQVDKVSLKRIPGSHALQTTVASRPKYQTDLCRFDGSDDGLLTSLVPSTSFSMMFKGKMTSDSKSFMGSYGTITTDACYLVTNATGNLSAAVGSGGTVFSSSPDIRGVLGVGALTFDGSTVKIYWNGAEVYSGAQSGSPTTTVAIALGCRNQNGTLGTFGDLDLHYALAIKKTLSASDVQAISEQWGY